MIYFLRRIKGIAYFFATLVLLQSCIAIYKKSSVADAETPMHDKWHIKVETVNGEKHCFDWIDERHGNIVSIHNTERILIDKEDVRQIVISDPAPKAIPLDSIKLYFGKASFLITDQRENFKSQDFIQFEDLGDSFKCYQMTSEDTLTVSIPLEQIDKIKVVNMDATAGASLLLWAAVLTGLGALAASNMEIPMNFSQ